MNNEYDTFIKGLAALEIYLRYDNTKKEKATLIYVFGNFQVKIACYKTHTMHDQEAGAELGDPASTLLKRSDGPSSQATPYADVAASLNSTDSDFVTVNHSSRRPRRGPTALTAATADSRSESESSSPPNRPQTQQHASIRDAGIEGNGSHLSSLQSARRSTSLNSPGPGGLFVTQLRPGTHFRDVRDHIFRQTGMRLKCLAVRSRNEHRYASFRVLCDAHELRRLLKPALWPKGCFVKKFEERL